MNIESIQLFSEVYRTQGFAEVAKRRNIAPSSVTRAIALLEDNLGFRLFHRTTRSVTPTEEGEKFFVRVTQWLEDFDSIRNEILGESQESKGTLRLTTNVSFNHVFLIHLIPQFQALHPCVKLEIQITDGTVDMVAERIDVAIRFGKLKDSDFMCVKLFDLDYALVASPEYFKKHQKPKELSELSKHKCLSFLLNQFHSVWKFKKNNKVRSINIESTIKVTGALSLIEYAKNGSGIALLPKRLIEQELRNAELVQVLKSYEATPTEFGSAAWLIYPSRNHLPTRTRAFIKFIKNKF